MRVEAKIAALAALAGCSAWGQFGFFRKMPQTDPGRVEVSARLEPSRPTVGTPCRFVLEFDVDDGTAVENLNVGGMPDADKVKYGERFEPLADGAKPGAGRSLRRWALQARFLAPFDAEVAPVVTGMLTARRSSGGMSFSSSTSFGKSVKPFRVVVEALPEKGRPADFSGAVGTGFAMRQSASNDKVRPGDLVTMTYELRFDGYCPEGVWPRIERLTKEFKAYEPKEVARTEKSVTWTQVLVPRTTAATNTAMVSLNYYNPETRRYEAAKSFPKRLEFVSERAASRENVSVVVSGGTESGGPTKGGAETLRFAPAETSPVVATVPAGTPMKTLERRDGWIRVETPRAAGWMRGTAEEGGR